MTEIVSITGREILDSRGNPTVEPMSPFWRGQGPRRCSLRRSTGEHEAVELRDGDKEHYMGKGALKAVENVEVRSSPPPAGWTRNQRLLDATMIAIDGTPNKSRLGANAILGVSMAAARASATR